jgi:hypothetical protein
MVAVIHSSSSLRNILNYNEQKVKTGAARCLEAAYYPKEAANLTFNQKLLRLEKLTELNQRTKVNSVHISLNFDPSEQLGAEKLKRISQDYLERIGFVGQPYLLYEHMDSGHPHLHIVTTNIKPDGARIALHNLGKNQSEEARRAIEKVYGLVEANKSALRETYRLKPVDARRVSYGKAETKKAITNVLQAIIGKYRFSSLAELNAVLKLYNVTADNGAENSRLRQHEGLLYHLLDEQGKAIGTPIKASLFYNNPGLKKLNVLFAENRLAKEPAKVRIRNEIDLALLPRKGSLRDMIRELKRTGIDMVIRQNDQGVIYGLTYIDHSSRVVLNGSDLGKAYSAKGVLERCADTGAAEKEKQLSRRQDGASEKVHGRRLEGIGEDKAKVSGAGFSGNSGDMGEGDFASALLEQQNVSDAIDFELRSTRRKRKKRRMRLD